MSAHLLLAQVHQLQQNNTCTHTRTHACNVFYPFSNILLSLLVLKITDFLLRQNDTEKQHQFGMQNGIGFLCLPNSYSAVLVRSSCRGTLENMKSKFPLLSGA